MQPPGPGEKFVKVEQTFEICKDNILLASFLFNCGYLDAGVSHEKHETGTYVRKGK